MSGPTHARVLAVDDDEAILKMLTRVLAEEGFHVDTATGAAQAVEIVTNHPPDVVLLDVMLADENGFDVLAQLRRTHDIPVILVTGKGAEADRVLGLRLGADDYVVKPFSYAELAARISTVLRRAAPKTPAPKAASTRKVFGRLIIDATSREVLIDGAIVDTTAKEFDLLSFLADSPRQVFSRQQLLEHVWDSSAEWQDPATVTEHVRRLRLKIEQDAERPLMIVTVRGVGYRFEPQL